MRHHTISLRRRHLIIAGLAGIAAPAGVFAAQSGGTPAAAEVSASGGELVVSGRILAPDGQPLADAAVEAWQPCASGLRASAITDADGRFMLAKSVCAEHDGRPQSIRYRVSHVKHTALETSPGFTLGQLQRDETGIWRTAVGLTLA